MKKLVFGLMLVAGVCSAACYGPFCYDDTGLYIGGILTDGNGTGTPNLTKAQMNAATPRAKGQEIYCSDCVRGYICISSGTTQGGYLVAVETGTFVAGSGTHCQ